MRLNSCTFLILALLTSISQAQGVFNTPNPQTTSDSNFYGASMPVHSPDYYNALIADKNKQTYQSMVNANKASQNDPQLQALQEQILKNDGSQSIPTTSTAQPPQNAPPPPTATPPQPNVIYQTPVANNQNSNNTATNFSGTASSSNSNASNNKNSSGGNLDIQY